MCFTRGHGYGLRCEGSITRRQVGEYKQTGMNSNCAVAAQRLRRPFSGSYNTSSFGWSRTAQSVGQGAFQRALVTACVTPRFCQ